MSNLPCWRFFLNNINEGFKYDVLIYVFIIFETDFILAYIDIAIGIVNMFWNRILRNFLSIFITSKSILIIINLIGLFAKKKNWMKMCIYKFMDGVQLLNIIKF